MSDKVLFGHKIDELVRIAREDGAAGLKALPRIGSARAAEILRVMEQRDLLTEPAAEASVQICAGKDCGAALSPDAVAKRHRFCPECFKAQRGQGRRRGVRGEGEWVPSEEKVRDAFGQVVGILAAIKRGNSFRDGSLRYDFSSADALLEEAEKLYVAGKFGQGELGGKAYGNILDALYQGVLGKANEVVALGKTADARRIVAEEGWDLGPLEAAETEVGYLLDGGKAKEAADEAHELLRSILRKRGEARKAVEADREAEEAKKREDFIASLREENETQADYEERQQQGGRRRGQRDRRGDERGQRRQQPRERYSRREGRSRGGYGGSDEE